MFYWNNWLMEAELLHSQKWKVKIFLSPGFFDADDLCMLQAFQSEKIFPQYDPIHEKWFLAVETPPHFTEFRPQMTSLIKHLAFWEETLPSVSYASPL